MPQCCGRTFKDSAALKAHKASDKHKQTSGGQPSSGGQKGRKAPKGIPVASNEIATMRVNVASMLNGVPQVAMAALRSIPNLSAEGLIWMACMLSPNSSDLAVRAKIPDHISTRSLAMKLVKANVELGSPDPAGGNGIWNCLIMQLPSIDISFLAIAWVGSGPPPNLAADSAAASNKIAYGLERWTRGTGSYANYWFWAQPTPFGEYEYVTAPNQGERAIISERDLVTSAAPIITFRTKVAVPYFAKGGNLEKDYSEWRLAANGMTILFQAPALSDQGTVYAVDCGRLHSEQAIVEMAMGASEQPAAPTGTALVSDDGGYPVTYLGNQSWVDDYAPNVTFDQTDICRHNAKLGSYTVLYPRRSEHPYRSMSTFGPLTFRNGSAVNGRGHDPVIFNNGTNQGIGYVRMDDTFGVKSVMYRGMSSAATLVMKNVAHCEMVVDPRGTQNSQVDVAYSYDEAAITAALRFAANLPVMFPSSDNDWGGFWKKVGNFLGKVPEWINKRARPWIRNMGGAVSGVIGDTKNAGEQIAGAF